MSLRVASALAVVFAVGMVGVACSSSDSNGNGSGLPAGCTNGSSGSAGSQACGSCIQASCSSEYNKCFGLGGACASWTGAGCQGQPPSECTSCLLGPFYSCQQSHCADKCNDTGDAGTKDTGSSAGSCATLAACCPSISADAGGPESCSMVASGGDESTCSSLLTGYKALGYCK